MTPPSGLHPVAGGPGTSSAAGQVEPPLVLAGACLGWPPSSPKHQWPIKKIVRPLSVSRAAVRKVIRGHQTEFRYERGVQPVPKLGEWLDVLTGILEKEAKLPRRERRSTQRLFEELRGRGRDERARVPVQAFVPMSFGPGEAYQFDRSHETITLQVQPLVIKAAHMKLSHSRMPS